MTSRILMRSILTMCLAMFYFALPVHLAAQQTLPRAISPDEMVTLDRSLSMKTALEILSQYSLRFDGKIIIDPGGHTAPINVMVSNMYWKRALEYVLRSNLLKFEERERHYEVQALAESGGGTAEAGLITQHTREVEINAVFFEADYATLVEAGVDWSLVRNGRVRVNGAFAQQVTQDLFNVQINERARSWDIFALLRTFESLNKGEFLANPTIKVLDGEQGRIQVGTNFFLTTRDFAGNTRFQEFEAGVILTVVPQVIGSNDSLYVHLDIKAERSSVTPDPVAVTKSITESETQVLLVNGEEAVIAGLFSKQETDSRRGIPILKDLPPWFFGLRYLFGYNSRGVTKKELVIILQASVLPTVEERYSSRRNRFNYLEQRRRQFKNKVRQLESNSAGDGGTTSNTLRRRR